MRKGKRNGSIFPAALYRALRITVFIWVTATAMLCFGAAQDVYARGMYIEAPSRADMAYNDARRILYISNGAEVLRYSLVSYSFLSPFQLGVSLMGMDLSPDGNTLAVADESFDGEAWEEGGTSWIHLIDLKTGQSTKVSFDRESGEGGTYSVAYGYDSSLLISLEFNGSGWVHLRRYDPVTQEVTQLGLINQDSMLCASADRSVIGFAESNSSSGPFGRYRVSDGNILVKEGYDDGTSWFNYEIGVNRDGTQYAIPTYGGTYICDNNLSKYDIIGEYAAGQPIGLVYHPTQDIVYFAWADTSTVRAYNTSTLTQIAEYDLESMFFSNGNNAYDNGRLKISKDGKLLFANVDSGVCFVRPNDKPPTTSSKSVSTPEDTPLTITLPGSDLDNDPLIYIVDQPAHGQLTGSGPDFVYTPAANYNGRDFFYFCVSDGDFQTATAKVTISVTSVNDPPVAVAQSLTIVEDKAVKIKLTGTDVENNPLRYAIVTPPSHGKLTGTAPNVIYTPAKSYNGQDSFTFKVGDATKTSAPTAVSITVTPTPVTEHTDIEAAKVKPSGSLVSFHDVVVTAVGLEPGVSYISSSDGLAGIKMLTSAQLKLGQRLVLKGYVGRVDGEWLINKCTITSALDGEPLNPQDVNSQIIGNDPKENLSYTGANATGLLVKMSGSVSAVIPPENVIYLSDDHPYSDGIRLVDGIRIKFLAGAALPAKGQNVAITGISRVAKYTLTQWGDINGQWYPAGTVVYVPSIWARSALDVQVL